jgi:hypothetical protein
MAHFSVDSRVETVVRYWVSDLESAAVHFVAGQYPLHFADPLMFRKSDGTLQTLLARQCILFLLPIFFLTLDPALAGNSAEAKRCRSIVAEAALVVELRSQGKVTETFAGGFLQSAQEQLQTSAGHSDLDGDVVAKLQEALLAINGRDASMLNRISNELYAREKLDEQHP